MNKTHIYTFICFIVVKYLFFSAYFFIFQKMDKKRCRRETDITKCVLCQSSHKSAIVTKPGINSYERLLQTVDERARFGEAEYFPISQRLQGLDPHQLEEQGFFWHRKCYADATNKTNIERSKNRYLKAVAQGDTTDLLKRKGRPSARPEGQSPLQPDADVRVTRSSVPLHKKELCFFCQKLTSEKLHMSRPENIGKQISTIVKKSGNALWQVKLAEVLNERDALSRNITYHKTCMTTEWRKCTYKNQQSQVEGACQEDYTKDFIAAEIHYFSYLEDRITSGEFIPISEAQRDYESVMRMHSLSHTVTRQALQKKIQEHIKDVNFTRPSNPAAPSLIHSSFSTKEAVTEAARDRDNEELTAVFKCSKIIRKAIERIEPWQFDGTTSAQHELIPNELMWMLKWIIQGDVVVKAETRCTQVDRTCRNLAQMIIQAHKTKRQTAHQPKCCENTFRSRTETPLTLGLSLYFYHLTRSKKHIDILSSVGVGVTYHQTTDRVNKIAAAVQENMKSNEGIYIPTGLKKGIVIRAAIDNIDAHVDTTDGKNSFHALASAVFQTKPGKDEEVDQPITRLNLQVRRHRETQDTTKTLIPLVRCNLKGNHKPSRKWKYVEFKPFQYREGLLESYLADKVWLILRYFGRCSDAPMTGNGVQQEVPLWAGYGSLTCSSTKTPDIVKALPIINAPPQDMQTLVTALMGLYQLNQKVSGNNTDPVCVWLDMDLYKRAFKLAYLHPNEYGGKWILFPGQFHVALCALRCLGRTIEGSGIEDMWVEADIYGVPVVSQILNGSHYSRAIKCHQITLQAFSDLWFEAFFANHPEILRDLKDVCAACQINHDVKQCHEIMVQKLEQLDILNLMDEFDTKHNTYPMYKWACMYMKQVENLLQFLRSTRDAKWELHLSSLEEMCTWFFAYNRLDYAMHIPEYLARMHSMKDTYPAIWNDLANGSFVVQKYPTNFTAIGVDQAQEHINKIHKGDGGIRGITTNPEALFKYCLASAELSHLSEEVENMLGVSYTTKTKHHDLSKSKLRYQEEQVRKLKDALSKSNPFIMEVPQDGSEPSLIHFTKHIVIKEDVQRSILNTMERGKEYYEKFVKDRICGDKSLWDPMSKVKYLTWHENNKVVHTKLSGENIALKASSTLMARLLILARSSREFDLKTAICTYEFSPVNAMLMTAEGYLHPCNDKSQLIHLLEEKAPVVISSPSGASGTSCSKSAIIIDGMAVVHEMAVHKDKICKCHDLSYYFVSAIESKSKNYTKTYVVFDQYTEGSLKELSRQRRAKGKTPNNAEYRVNGNTHIMDFNRFLSNTKTKKNLTQFLATEVVKNINGNITAITHMGLFNKTTGGDILQSDCCKHDEADTMLIFYASEAHRQGYTVNIYSPDTDVMVLALYYLPSLGHDVTMTTGTGETRRTIPLLPIRQALGEHHSEAIIGFHALSGCDTNGRIFGKSKTTWWAVFMLCDESILVALSQLGMNYELSSQVLHKCEEFVCKLLSPKNVALSSAAELRWYQFRGLKSNQSPDKLPPTKGSLHEHIRRAHYQCTIWKQALEADMRKGSPTEFGWSISETSGGYIPTLSRVPIAPDSILQLVRCRCVKSQCSGRCSCRENSMSCTELCACDPDSCRNVHDPAAGDNEDNDSLSDW